MLKMLAVILMCLLAGANAQSYEERVMEDMETWWDLFGKDAITAADLDEFYYKYADPAPILWTVNENEFGRGYSADMSITEKMARGYFKRFDMNRYAFDQLEDEVISFVCSAQQEYMCDFNEDGGIDRDEFLQCFYFLSYDLVWSVMFIDYRTLITSPPNYNDFILPQTWELLFNNTDTNDDNQLSLGEVEQFYVGGGYGISDTAYQFYLFCGPDLVNGLISRDSFNQVYTFLDSTSDNGGNGNGLLEFQEFLTIDWYVRPFLAGKREKIISRINSSA